MVNDFYTFIQGCIPDYSKSFPFYKHHLYLLSFSKDPLRLKETIPDYFSYVETQASFGHSCTIMVDNQPHLIFGFFQLYHNVYECWMIFDGKTKRYSIPFLKSTKRIFDKIPDFLTIKRLQMYILSSNPTNIRYAKYAKFQNEGLLRSYGPDGSDYNIYARIY